MTRTTRNTRNLAILASIESGGDGQERKHKRTSATRQRVARGGIGRTRHTEPLTDEPGCICESYRVAAVIVSKEGG